MTKPPIDFYFDIFSPFAYIAATQIDALAAIVHPDFAPDLTLLFDTDASTARARVIARSATDRFEREDLGFFERVRARYLEQARLEPRRFCLLDAGQSIAGVQAAIARAIALHAG